MKKKIILRALMGAPIGLTICMFVTIIVSACMGGGEYSAAHPGLIDFCGNELTAVILQMVGSMFYGAVWSAASVIWEVERWSLMRQTVLHFLVCSLSALPIAYLMHWFPHNIFGALGYFATFFFSYLGIWLGQYISMRKRIRQFNKKVANN